MSMQITPANIIKSLHGIHCRLLHTHTSPERQKGCKFRQLRSVSILTFGVEIYPATGNWQGKPENGLASYVAVQGGEHSGGGLRHACMRIKTCST